MKLKKYLRDLATKKSQVMLEMVADGAVGTEARKQLVSKCLGRKTVEKSVAFLSRRSEMSASVTNGKVEIATLS